MPLRVIPRRDRKVNRLVKRATEVRYRRSDVVFSRGDASESVYLVREGHVRLTLSRHGSRGRRTVAVVGPWELFGEEALDGTPRRYEAVAGEACAVLPLSGHGLIRAFRGSPKTLSVFLASLEDDLADAREAARTSSLTTKARIARVLLNLAERFGTEEGKRIRIAHWFTHQEIADLARAHRSTVTTALNDWIYEKVLREEPRAIVIVRPAALRQATRAGA